MRWLLAQYIAARAHRAGHFGRARGSPAFPFIGSLLGALTCEPRAGRTPIMPEGDKLTSASRRHESKVGEWDFHHFEERPRGESRISSRAGKERIFKSHYAKSNQIMLRPVGLGIRSQVCTCAACLLVVHNNFAAHYLLF